MIVLALDTCTNSCSVTIFEDNKILSSCFTNMRITHSETILPAIDHALNLSGKTLSDIDLFSCSIGPGSFTGIRIGISIVKGFCLSTKKMCIGVSSLLGLAYNLTDIDGFIVPVLDAKRNQFYTALFNCKENQITRLTEDTAIDIDSFEKLIEHCDKNIYLLGDGAKKCYDRYSHNKNIKLASEITIYNNSIGIGLATITCFNQKNYIEGKNLLPSYIRLSQAQQDLKSKKERY
ncbi:MAG: tRNA (adenosine(37)-N6)-threonylcarbamoyltransferase complex dimerization subunit type 1 TsaB [Oscillospiraceae bacterium]